MSTNNWGAQAEKLVSIPEDFLEMPALVHLRLSFCARAVVTHLAGGSCTTQSMDTLRQGRRYYSSGHTLWSLFVIFGIVSPFLIRNPMFMRTGYYS